MEKMTKQQAIEALEALGFDGDGLVGQVGCENCELTSRCMPAGDSSLEYRAAVSFNDGDNTLEMYYYVDKDWVDSLDDDCNYEGLVNWETAFSHYEIY